MPAELTVADPSRVSDHYRMVVMQHETLCNLDCRYCYLPDRKISKRMDPSIAARVAADIAAQLTHPDSPPQIPVLWHCSEPLATPKAHFEDVLDPFEILRRAGKVRHIIQTNATLIDGPWCEILTRYDVQVGVSLDGPPDLNADRIDRGGKPAYDKIMRGIHRLRAAGIDPNVICVVTPDSVHHGARLMRFFRDEGFTNVSFNIEEREGVNTQRTQVTVEEARQFWREVLDEPGTQRIRIRDFANVANYLQGSPALVRDPIPTITREGDIVLLSPELAGTKSEHYGDFIAGNIAYESIQSVLARQHSIPYVADFEKGLAQCRAHCSFWDVCHGAYASNRYAETGSLAIMETDHCRKTNQAPVLAMLDLADPVDDADLIAKLTPLARQEINA